MPAKPSRVSRPAPRLFDAVAAWLSPERAATAAAVASLALLAACGGSGDAPETDSASAPPKLSPDELAALYEAGGITFLDVRSIDEIRELGTLSGHLHIPIDELEDRLSEIPPDLPVVTA